MRKVIFKCTIFILLAICIIPPVFSNEYQDIYNQAWQLINNNFYDSTMNHQQWSYWQKRYNIKTQDDLVVAIESMLASLNDPYTRYLQKNNFSEETNAIHVDCTNSISNTPRYFRTKIPKNIEYIRIDSFMNKNLSKEFSEYIEKSEKNINLIGYIIDLRDDGGGLVKNASEIADIFLDNKVVVYVQTNNKKMRNTTKPGVLSKKPVVILINGYTASACEVFSGTMQDNKRATIIGTQSFGKGIIQKINKLKDGSGINITVMSYNTPNGSSINHKGITPDIEVWFTFKDIFFHNDIQLKEAIKYLQLSVAH